MPEHGAKVGLLDEDVCILLHSAARLHAAESDEEIDSRLRFEIAHAVADECRLSMRARADVAHDELLAAGPCEKRSPIELAIIAGVVECERDRVHSARWNAELRCEWRDSLSDSGGDEMDDNIVLAQRRDRFACAV